MGAENLSNHHVEKFQENLVKWFQDKNAIQFQEEYLNKNVAKFQDKVVDLFQNNNVDQFQDNNAKLCLANLVALYLIRFVKELIKLAMTDLQHLYQTVT